ncbi:hypothetical protein BZA70DRAFT_19609 [Myxozyma melibiosi]|uniref:SH3 domain-containing protein n=1 Tax=Myxozyma melibiosi TaxID=54550 RepID=A0ABR1FEZ5_9ASCO
MSLRGIKKAVIRAPHVLIGSKSPEDLTVIEWTKAINEAEDGMGEIISNAKKFRSAWIDSLAHQVGMAKQFVELYEPIPMEDPTKVVRETPKATLDAIIKYRDVVVEIQNAIVPMLDGIDRTIIQRCVVMKGHIETIKKTLKRENIDYDRHSNSVEKLNRKQTLGDKAQLSLDKQSKELDKASEDFKALDDYIKETMPKVIEQLSEFIAPLATMLFNIQISVVSIYNDFMFPFAQGQGLADPEHSVTEEWTKQFIPIQHKCEEGLAIIRTGKAVKKPMTHPDSKHLDEKLKKAFTLNNKKRPTGTAKDGSYRNFSSMNRTASMGRVGSDLGSESGAEADGSPDPSRAFSMSSHSSKFANFSEALPRYSTVAVPAAGTPLSEGGDAATEATAALKEKEGTNGYHADVKEKSEPAAANLAGSTGEDERGKYEIMTAQYTFVAVQDSDLSFNVGDKIKVYKRDEDDWWEGETMDGRKGEFPGNYVK